MRQSARFCLAVLFGALALARAAAADVTIGVAAPLSGPDAVFGDQIRVGAAQAIADLNQLGGFLGQQGRLVARDDGSDPKKAGDLAKAFVAQHVPFVIGDFSSAVTVAASPVYADGGVLEITPSALAPMVTDRDLTRLFRMCGRDDQQADVAARAVLSKHLAKVAIVHDRTSAGKDFADRVRQALGKEGVREALYGSLEKGSRDASGLVSRIKASGAQVVVFGGSSAEAGLLARQLHDANAHATLLGTAALATDEFAITADGGTDGTMMVFPQNVKARPAAADLLRRFRESRIDPDAYVFYAYAAVQVLQQAVGIAHSLDPAKVAAAMHDGHGFRTVIGDIAFDAKGDPTAPDYAIYVWHRGATGRMTFDEQAKS